jgi:hypothetical protein
MFINTVRRNIAEATADGVVTAAEARKIVGSLRGPLDTSSLTEGILDVAGVYENRQHALTPSARRVFDAFFAPKAVRFQTSYETLAEEERDSPMFSGLSLALFTDSVLVGQDVCRSRREPLNAMASMVALHRNGGSLAAHALSSPPADADALLKAPYVSVPGGPFRVLHINDKSGVYFFSEQAKIYGPFSIGTALATYAD